MTKRAAANMRVMMERFAAPRFQPLFEKPDAREKKTAPTQRVEAAKDRAGALEGIVRPPSRETAGLKRARPNRSTETAP